MTKEEFIQKVIKYAVESPDNYVTEENAIFPELVGMNWSLLGAFNDVLACRYHHSSGNQQIEASNAFETHLYL